uniref:Heme transporter CcmC n=1 Tax=Heterorhabditis bacteriophora TaxID=37862 RepID=A0A1I7WPT2_HETBA
MKFKLETSKIIAPHPKKVWINLVAEKREKKEDKGILTVVCFFIVLVFALFGTFTNLIYEHHRDSQLLRSLYEMHWLNPDDEKTQTVVSSLALFTLLICLIISGYSWYVMWKTYKCYKANDRTICPGYQKGMITNNTDI